MTFETDSEIARAPPSHHPGLLVGVDIIGELKGDWAANSVRPCLR
jgi:hypothetical protein